MTCFGLTLAVFRPKVFFKRNASRISAKKRGEVMSIRAYEILVVDDNTSCRNILEHQLRKLSYTNIDVARDGIEALRCLASKHYDLIFLDNHMPMMSGIDFLRRCKEVSILDGTSVIMLTGMADGAMLQSVKAEGLKVDDFIVKPLESKTLRAKIERLDGLRASWSAASRNTDTGAFLSIQMDVKDDVSRLRLFGIFHQDDKHAIKDIPDRVAAVSTKTVVIDMRDVMSIDEFGLGMLLLINGVACLTQKLTYLLLDGRTIRARLESLGISEIIRVIEHEAEILPRLA